MGNRFAYEQGDIELKDSQCGFCRYNRAEDRLKCDKYPEKKPDEVLENRVVCPFLFQDRD